MSFPMYAAVAAAAAHDVHEEATIILLAVDVIEQRLPPGDPLSKLADDARAAACRLAHAGQRLLAFAAGAGAKASANTLAQTIEECLR